MYKFIKLQYQFFKTINAEQVQSFVSKYITQEQANEIIGK